MTNATPSLRQFRAIPEKSSLCHLIVSLDPTAIGVLIRMQTPDGEVSSILAGARCAVPAWSFQQTSATAIMAVLDSVTWTDWFTTSFTSTQKNRTLVPWGLALVIGLPSAEGEQTRTCARRNAVEACRHGRPPPRR